MIDDKKCIFYPFLSIYFFEIKSGISPIATVVEPPEASGAAEWSGLNGKSTTMIDDSAFRLVSELVVKAYSAFVFSLSMLRMSMDRLSSGGLLVCLLPIP